MLNCKRSGFGESLAVGSSCLILLLGFALPAMASWAGKARFSTQNALWANETRVPLVNSASVSNTIDIDTATTYQVIDGFGGCFNENGGKALKAVSTRLADSVADVLMNWAGTP